MVTKRQPVKTSEKIETSKPASKSYKRTQTMEGWKRSMLKKGKTPKQLSGF